MVKNNSYAINRVCGVFLIDSHFMVDGGKFISGAMAALSVMVNLEVPHVNVLSKVIEKVGVLDGGKVEIFKRSDKINIT